MEEMLKTIIKQNIKNETLIRCILGYLGMEKEKIDKLVEKINKEIDKEINNIIQTKEDK